MPNTGNNEFQSPSSSPTQDFLLSSNTSNNISNLLANGENTESSASSSPGRLMESADLAVAQIQADKSEAQHAIATYGVNSVELLHTVERWTQDLLGEYLSLHSRFKRILREKWGKKEFQLNSEFNRRTKTLYQHIHELEEAKMNCFSKKSFDDWNQIISKIDQDTNINELKQKINNSINTYLKIVDSLEFIELYRGEGSGTSFSTIKTILEKLKVLNNKQSHTICIIGLEKCGKSTYINALLGFELLPTANERCTQIRTILKPQLRDNSSVFGTVQFYSDEEFEKLFKQISKKSDELDQDFQTRKTKVSDTRRQLLTSFPTREQIFKLNDDEQNTDKKRDEILKQLHEYIVNEIYVNIIKDISIYTDKLPGNNYELLDVPGFDSPIEEHRIAGLQAIQTADAFLFLSDGGRPSLTRDQIRLLDEIQDGKQHYEAMNRAFGIITKLDFCHTKEDYDDCFTKSNQELIDKGFKPMHIFSVCSITNLMDPKSEKYKSIMNKITHFDNLHNGFERSKAALNQFIELELPKTHLRQLIDIGNNNLRRYVNDSLINAKKFLPPDVNFSNESSFDDYIKQENDEKWDQIYNGEIFRPIFDKANIWQKTELAEKRTQFIKDVKTKFRDCFINLTKEFVARPHDIKMMLMKQYGYTALYSTSQTIDDQLREKLSFELEKFVLQTSNTLTRHLYDEYVSQLERILNEIGQEENSDIYRTQLLSYDICKFEIRALILRTCRPVITATLRFSHSDTKSRQNAVNELVLLAPFVAGHLCNHSNDENEANSTLSDWTPTLKKGIQLALGIYGTTGVQNKMTAEVLKIVLDKIV